MKTEKENDNIELDVEKKYEQMPPMDFNITSIVARKQKDGKGIKQIRFYCEGNDILTYKPYLSQTITEKDSSTGITTEEKQIRSPLLSELPEEVLAIASELKKEKECLINTTYTLLTLYDKKGELKQYKFLNSDDLSSLEIKN